MRDKREFWLIDMVERRGVEMFYLYKKDDATPEILSKDFDRLIREAEEMEDLEDLEIIMAAENADEIVAYLKSYYNYTDDEVIKYLSDFDIIL